MRLPQRSPWIKWADASRACAVVTPIVPPQGAHAPHLPQFYLLPQQSGRAAPRLEAGGGHRWGQQPVAVEVADHPEARRLEADPVAVPGVALLDDLLVAAADEVPPHHDVLLERLAAEQHQDRRLAVRGRAEGQLAP